MRIRKQQPKEKIELQLTPMIDVVFQLLAFFVITFKIVAPEGDFNIRMPLAVVDGMSFNEEIQVPVKIHLSADDHGHLQAIQLGTRNLAPNPTLLRQEVMAMLGQDATQSPLDLMEIELSCDYQLEYRHVIATITAVSGYRDQDRKIIKLFERIKFIPPQKPTL